MYGQVDAYQSPHSQAFGARNPVAFDFLDEAFGAIDATYAIDEIDLIEMMDEEEEDEEFGLFKKLRRKKRQKRKGNREDRASKMSLEKLERKIDKLEGRKRLNKRKQRKLNILKRELASREGEDEDFGTDEDLYGLIEEVFGAATFTDEDIIYLLPEGDDDDEFGAFYHRKERRKEIQEDRKARKEARKRTGKKLGKLGKHGVMADRQKRKRLVQEAVRSASGARWGKVKTLGKTIRTLDTKIRQARGRGPAKSDSVLAAIIRYSTGSADKRDVLTAIKNRKPRTGKKRGRRS